MSRSLLLVLLILCLILTLGLRWTTRCNSPRGIHRVGKKWSIKEFCYNFVPFAFAFVTYIHCGDNRNVKNVHIHINF